MTLHGTAPSRTRWLTRAIIAWAVGFFLATDVRAQNAPIQPWSLTLGAGEAYDSNAGFSGPKGRGDTASNLQVGLGRSWTSRRGDMMFKGNAGQSFYRQITTLNQFTYGFVGSANYAITRRLSWTVGDSLSSNYARDIRVLTDAGLLLPTVITRSNSAATQLTYALTPKTGVRWKLAETNIGFSSRQFIGGANVTTSLGIERQMSRSQTLGVTHSFQRTFSNGEQSVIQSLLGTWQATAGKVVTLNATAGLRSYTLPGQRGYRFSPGGSLGLRARPSKSHTLGLTYERIIEQTFGLSNRTHLVHLVTANYGLSLGTRLAFELGGSYSRGTDPLLPNLRILGQLGTASIRYSATPKLGVVITSSAFGSTFDPFPTVKDYRTMMSLTYGTAWR
jgi:hypothetical protein